MPVPAGNHGNCPCSSSQLCGRDSSRMRMEPEWEVRFCPPNLTLIDLLKDGEMSGRVFSPMR